jgi:multiple sugar transport system permease protein
VRRSWVGWGLLTPTLVVLVITGLLPFVYVLWVGFYDWNPLSSATGEMSFSGVENYRRLVFDPAFLGALGRTVKFTLWAVASELALGYLLAQLLMRDFRGKSLFRLVHTLPLVVAPIAVGAIWRLLVIPGFGPVPHYLQQWFGASYNIGRSPSQAFLTTVLMDVWHWTPLVTLTMLAGLTSLPREPFEQAQVDGANRLQTFRYITLPLIMPVVLTTVFLRVMDSLRIVDEVFMLTGGGPGVSTRYVGIHIFRVVFPKTDYGYGSAMSLLVLYLTIVLSWLLYAAITARRSVRRAVV